MMRRNHTYSIDVTMVVWECSSCGIVYGIPKKFADDCWASGRRYYCPNGHSLGWSRTAADRERARADKAERQLRSERVTSRRWRERAEEEARSAAAYKGHLTRARNRIAAGICPVPGCKRSGFTRVMAHIASQHPDWLHEHSGGLDD